MMSYLLVISKMEIDIVQVPGKSYVLRRWPLPLPYQEARGHQRHCPYNTTPSRLHTHNAAHTNTHSMKVLHLPGKVHSAKGLIAGLQDLLIHKVSPFTSTSVLKFPDGQIRSSNDSALSLSQCPAPLGSRRTGFESCFCSCQPLYIPSILD